MTTIAKTAVKLLAHADGSARLSEQDARGIADTLLQWQRLMVEGLALNTKVGFQLHKSRWRDDVRQALGIDRLRERQ